MIADHVKLGRVPNSIKYLFSTTSLVFYETLWPYSSWGRVNFTLPKLFFSYWKLQQTFGLTQFFNKPNLVLKFFWKFLVNTMPISRSMTILWGEVIRCFLLQNFLYYYKYYATSKYHNHLNIYSFFLIVGTIVLLY